MNTYPLEKFYIYFSPYTSHAIEIDGIVYPTVEHAYQCARYDDPNIINEILSARSPIIAWEVSSRYKAVQIPTFRSHKRETMKELMRNKLLQHEDVRQALIDSGDMEIIKKITTYPPGDGYWDIGEDGKGQNEIGKIWMELRKELK